MARWDVVVTLQSLVGAAIIAIVLLLLPIVASFVYFSKRTKVLRRQIAILEFEMKIVAGRLGMMTTRQMQNCKDGGETER